MEGRLEDLWLRTRGKRGAAAGKDFREGVVYAISNVRSLVFGAQTAEPEAPVPKS